MSEPTYPHRFTVRRTAEGWSVSLPHQCDRWDIAGEEYEGVPHARAVAELEQFIAEAQDALVHLKAEQQVEFTWSFGADAPTRVVS